MTTAHAFLQEARRRGAAVIYDGDEWSLVAEHVFDLGGLQIRIPAGFRFDLASIPRVVWIAIAPYELSVEAPLLHDYLYRRAGLPEPNECDPWRTFTRREADQLFLEEMRARGVSWWRRTAAYHAVRLFGARAFRALPPLVLA